MEGKIPLIEFAPNLVDPSPTAQRIQGLLDVFQIAEGSAMAARADDKGLWVFYEGGVFDDNRDPTRDYEKWAQIAAYRARDNVPTVARFFLRAEDFDLADGHVFVQVGEMDPQTGEIRRFWEPIKFPR